MGAQAGGRQLRRGRRLLDVGPRTAGGGNGAAVACRRAEVHRAPPHAPRPEIRRAPVGPPVGRPAEACAMGLLRGVCAVCSTTVRALGRVAPGQVRAPLQLLDPEGRAGGGRRHRREHVEPGATGGAHR